MVQRVFAIEHYSQNCNPLVLLSFCI